MLVGVILFLYLSTVSCFVKTRRISSNLKMSDVSRLLPSNQIQQSWFNGVGKPWSYGDLFELSANKQIQAFIYHK